MKKITIAIFLIALLSGCGAHAPHNQWRAMKFSTPPDRTDQDRTAAEAGCIKKIDKSSSEGTVWLVGAAAYYMKKSYEYQDCMAVQGFPCKDDVYRCAYEPGKK